MPDYPSLSTLGGALRDYWNRAGSFPMTTSTGVTITPQDINRGMNLGMSFSGGGLSTFSEPLFHGSPTRNLESLNPSDRGPLGPGLYTTPTKDLAQHGYAGTEGQVYQMPEQDRDIFRGVGHRTDAEYFGWKDDIKRLIDAASDEMRPKVKE